MDMFNKIFGSKHPQDGSFRKEKKETKNKKHKKGVSWKNNDNDSTFETSHEDERKEQKVKNTLGPRTESNIKLKHIHDKQPPTRPRELSFNGVDISDDDITILERIGQDDNHKDKGMTSVVYKALCKGMDVCVKEMKIARNRVSKDHEEKVMQAFLQEVKILSDINHSNVCMFYGVSLTPGKWRLGRRYIECTHFFAVTELCKKDLADHLKHDGHKLSLFDRLLLGRDICRGLAWLHHCGVLHCDVKPENFLIDENDKVKVADFGYSKIVIANKLGIDVTDTQQLEGGSFLYLPPERLLGEEYSYPADVYAFAIVLWQILTLKEPFQYYQELNDKEIFREAVLSGKRPHIPDLFKRVYPEVGELLKAAWDEDPAKRPSFAQLIEMIDNLLVSFAVRDEKARKFWRKHFITKARDLETNKEAEIATLTLKVPWLEFANLFLPLINVDTSILQDQLPDCLSDEELKNPSLKQLQCAEDSQLEKYAATSDAAREQVIKERIRRQLLIDISGLRAALVDEKDRVNLVRFGKIIDSFGPIKNNVLLANIANTVRESWYWGDLDKDKAYSMLKGKDIGTYLVRFSSRSNEFVISAVIEKGNAKVVLHFRVKHDEKDGFSIPGSDHFPTIKLLLRATDKKFRFPLLYDSKHEMLTKYVPMAKDDGYYGDSDGEATPKNQRLKFYTATSDNSNYTRRMANSY